MLPPMGGVAGCKATARAYLLAGAGAGWCAEYSSFVLENSYFGHVPEITKTALTMVAAVG